MEDKDKFVDALLDCALARRREAAPAPGLEARILERVRAAAGRSAGARGFWGFPAGGWIAAGAVAAVLAVFFVARLADRQHAPQIPSPQARSAAPAQPASKSPAPGPETTQGARAVAEAAIPQPARRHKAQQARRSKAPHWPAQFPTPAPLSQQEKALIQLVQNTPPQVLAELFKKPRQHVEIKPLELPNLKIEPWVLGATSRRSE